MKATDTLQFRAGLSSGISRPDFSDLQGYTTLSQNVDNSSGLVTYTGTGTGNPNLRPVKSHQFDLTAEWYFSKSGSLTVALFNKQLKDVIIKKSYGYDLADNTGKPYTFMVTGPVNGADGHARGAEIAYQQYFDMLPGWLSGFGVQANYTYVDSKTDLHQPVHSVYCSGGNSATNFNLNLNGCDIDGRTFGDLPLIGLSRQSYNLALMYDKGPLSMRLAWNWRSKNLQNVNVNGTQGSDGTDTNPDSPTVGQHNVAWALPTWADSYGQLDGSIIYNITENLSIGLEAQNLTDSKFRQLMQQGIGFKGRAWFVSGPRYTAQMRYSF
jgi:TonB-dependent receptor